MLGINISLKFADYPDQDQENAMRNALYRIQSEAEDAVRGGPAS